MKNLLSFLFLLISVSTYATDHVKIKYRLIENGEVLWNKELNYDGCYHWTQFRDGNEPDPTGPRKNYHKPGVPYIVAPTIVCDGYGNPEEGYRFLDRSITDTGSSDGAHDYHCLGHLIEDTLLSNWHMTNIDNFTLPENRWVDQHGATWTAISFVKSMRTYRYVDHMAIEQTMEITEVTVR